MQQGLTIYFNNTDNEVYLSKAMFDLQVNGLSTKDFSCDFWQAPDDESITALRKYELEMGIEKFLATLITAPLDQIKKNLERIKVYKERFSETEGAEIYGVHMEGGLISKLGIHPEANAKEFNLQNVKELIKEFPGLIKLWTLCPKMDTNGDITKLLQDSDIKVAYGHSQANYDEAMEAFEKYKVNLVTHWPNALKTFPGFKHRGGTKADIETLENMDINNVIDSSEIGIAVAAYQNPDIYVTAIAGSEEDGDLHMDGYLLHKLAEKKAGKFILVSDSVACDGSGQLRGGMKTLGKHLENALANMVEIHEVQAATSITPYEIMGI